MDNEKRKAEIDGLRRFADMMEQFPNIRMDVRGWCWCDTKEDFATAMRALGHSEKESSVFFLIARGNLSALQVNVAIPHEIVCERIVTQRVVPAQPRKEIVLEAQSERVEEIVSWKCPESVLAPAEVQEVFERR